MLTSLKVRGVRGETRSDWKLSELTAEQIVSELSSRIKEMDKDMDERIREKRSIGSVITKKN